MATLPRAGTPVSPRGPWRLWLYGLGMLAPVIYFAWRYPLAGNSERLLDIGKLSRYQPGPFVAFVAGMAALFGLYVLALFESRRLAPRRAAPPVFLCGAALAYGMAWMYPVNAIDVFHYALRSRLLTTYGLNPLVALFVDFPNDPWTRYSHGQWAKMASPYGPLWNQLAAPITWLAGDRIVVALVCFKLLMLFCLLLSGWAVWKTLVVVAPSRAATGALFLLWNPLVLWEAVGNGHNDMVMVLPLLWALLAWARRRDHLVIPLLVAAAMIKYVPLLFVPLAAVVLWRRTEGWPARLRLIGWSGLLSTLIVALSLFPFFDMDAVRTSVAQQGNILRMSPASMAFTLLQKHYSGADIKHWARLLGVSTVLLVLAWQSLLLWRRPSALPRAIFEVMYVFLLVATWYFNGWYLIWPVAVAALLPLGWPAWRMIAWCVGAMAGYGLIIWIEAWWQPGFATIQNVAVPLMFGATLLLTLAEAVYRLLRRPPSRREGTSVEPGGPPWQASSQARA